MLDRRFIVENTELVRQNCAARGVHPDVDQFVALETRRRDVAQSVQELNRQANEVSKSIGKANNDAEREARKLEGRNLRDQRDAAEKEHAELDAGILAIQRTIPNLSHPDAPLGADENASREIRRGR
ncbi:MAG TPA: serine--tRNA ligase, partial [Pirellulaceae bacterium]